MCVLKDCTLFNNQYVCQKCFDGFNLVSVNNVLICQRAFNSTCNDGFYFSQSRGQCVQINIDFCKYVNPNSPSVCLACFTNYILNNGTCTST